MVNELFEPRSVAIIGASRFKGKVGNSIARNMLRFRRVFFVNPKAKQLFGRRCYRSVLDIAQPVDLVVIAVRPAIVPAVLEECGKAGVKAVIIITAGFGEAGNRAAEKRLVRIAKRYGIRLLGPNCFGTINPYLALNTSFAATPALKGDIAFLSQSGALCAGVLDLALREKIGFSAFASIGNEADVDFVDLLEYCAADPRTKVIILYIEALKEGTGRRFLQIVKKCTKPIIAIKAGISEKGIKAALTHTGSLAGSYAIYQAAFRQARILETRSLQNALDSARFLTCYKPPKSAVVVTNAGGPGVLAADYCESAGIKLVKLSSSLIKKLNARLPAAWSRSNPIDVVGDADAARYKRVLDALAKEQFDCLLCILTPQQMSQPTETARALVQFARSGKAVLASFIGGKQVKEGADLLNRAGILCFEELKRACDILATAAAATIQK